MALTSSGSVNVEGAPSNNPQGTPNKNIVGAASAGPNTAKFPGVQSDSNASGEVPDVSGGDADAKASAIFGNPPAAPRVSGVAAQAAAATPGSGATNESAAFIDGTGKSWSDV